MDGQPLKSILLTHNGSLFVQALWKQPASMMGVSPPSTLLSPSPELRSLLGELTLFIATELYDFRELLLQPTDDGCTEDLYESILANAYPVESLLCLVRTALT